MKRPWTVLFYENSTGKTPVLDFLRKQPKVDRARLGHAIDELEWHGTKLRLPLSRPLSLSENLFELRVSGEDNIFRILYFHFTGTTFVLLHAFVKKTQKTPSNEIDIALKRLKDFKKNNKES